MADATRESAAPRRTKQTQAISYDIGWWIEMTGVPTVWSRRG